LRTTKTIDKTANDLVEKQSLELIALTE